MLRWRFFQIFALSNGSFLQHNSMKLTLSFRQTFPCALSFLLLKPLFHLPKVDCAVCNKHQHPAENNQEQADCKAHVCPVGVLPHFDVLYFCSRCCKKQNSHKREDEYNGI